MESKQKILYVQLFYLGLAYNLKSNAGHKKLKKPNTSGRNGHNGCSRSYNFNEYKSYSQEYMNSQGREELHSILVKCIESLRGMSYDSFMIWIAAFFAIHNLTNMGLN